MDTGCSAGRPGRLQHAHHGVVAVLGGDANGAVRGLDGHQERNSVGAALHLGGGLLAGRAFLDAGDLCLQVGDDLVTRAVGTFLLRFSFRAHGHRSFRE